MRVISTYMGGGFGSKLEPGKYTVIAALLARKTGRPVKCFLSREETFLCVGNRPPNTLDAEGGGEEGRDAHRPPAHGPGHERRLPGRLRRRLPGHRPLPCPNVRIEETDVFINAGKARAFRAPGFPQCAWALEQVMDALAEKLGMDPVELRLKNVPTVSQRRNNKPYTSTGLARCLQGRRRGLRLEGGPGDSRAGGDPSCGAWASPPACGAGTASRAPPPSSSYAADGSVNLTMGASDLGTGTKTVMAMVVAEELGVALDAHPDRLRRHRDDTVAPSSPAAARPST